MAKKPEVEATSKEEKVKKLREKLNKNYGEGSVLGGEEVAPIEVVSTGSVGLDEALGIGGLPYGRIVEIYGPESSGKTTISIETLINVQKDGKLVHIIDVEHALDLEYAKNLGLSTDDDKLLFSQPDWGEQALNIACDSIESGLVGAVLIDSVAALTPKAEIDGDVGDSKMGLQARMMGQMLRKIVAAGHNNNVLVIFINQLREKIGVMFGSPETTTGGNALKFYASVRLDIRKTMSNKEGEEIVSNTVKVTVKKNKMAPPFKKCEFRIGFGVGIETQREVMNMAIDFDIIKQSGSWFSYMDNKLGQGADTVLGLLKDNDALYEEIAAKVKAKLKENKDYLKIDEKAAALGEDKDE